MGKDLTDALSELTEAYRNGAPVPNSLPPPLRPSKIPPRVGQAGKTATSGGGLAGPLVEKGYDKREFWPERNIATTDGILVVKVRPVKKMLMTDGTGADVELLFSERSGG